MSLTSFKVSLAGIFVILPTKTPKYLYIQAWDMFLTITRDSVLLLLPNIFIDLAELITLSRYR